MQAIGANFSATGIGSAPGAASEPCARRSAGFTLIEMLLVLALIAMFATLFVVNAGALVKQSATQVVEARFWEAVREARSDAIIGRDAQSLHFDKKALAFVVEDTVTGQVRNFPIKHDDLPPDTELTIALKKRVDQSQHTLVAGELVDLREIPEVRFFPDGACIPFVAAFRVGTVDRQIEIDPWTGAELLGSDDK